MLKKMTVLNADQLELQFGFTKYIAHYIASMLLSESVIDSRARKLPLYIATRDSQKAYDVVYHQILLQNIYSQPCMFGRSFNPCMQT